jgi:hypothetical protein
VKYLKEQPSPQQLEALIERCKAFVQDVSTIVMDETHTWDKEFSNVLQKLDRSAQIHARTVAGRI